MSRRQLKQAYTFSPLIRCHTSTLTPRQKMLFAKNSQIYLSIYPTHLFPMTSALPSRLLLPALLSITSFHQRPGLSIRRVGEYMCVRACDCLPLRAGVCVCVCVTMAERCNLYGPGNFNSSREDLAFVSHHTGVERGFQSRLRNDGDE